MSPVRTISNLPGFMPMHQKEENGIAIQKQIWTCGAAESLGWGVKAEVESGGQRGWGWGWGGGCSGGGGSRLVPKLNASDGVPLTSYSTRAENETQTSKLWNRHETNILSLHRNR